jgi:hypothetical protein
LIIVSKVNVKDEFSAEGSECALSDSLLVPWLTQIEMMDWTRGKGIRYPCGENRTDLETGWQERYLLLEVVEGGEGDVTEVDHQENVETFV